ncbi:hypothetical protein [Ralstonia solanacearum]|nr:hypothetical protein [Ralstonia solanacearum]
MNISEIVDAIHMLAAFKPRGLMARPVTLWIQQTGRTYAYTLTPNANT